MSLMFSLYSDALYPGYIAVLAVRIYQHFYLALTAKRQTPFYLIFDK